MEPRSGSRMEDVIRCVRDFAAAAGVSTPQAADNIVRAINAHAGPAGFVGTSLGRNVGKTAANETLLKLLSTGCISIDEARRRLELEEEDEMVRRRRRAQSSEEVPPEAAPIYGYLRIHRDPMALKTSIYYKDGQLLLHIDEQLDKRPIGQIIVEDLVPRICSGCGGLLETPLCDPCRAEAIADLGDVLRGR